VSNKFKVGRNELCVCGSGYKYKDCCHKRGIKFDVEDCKQHIKLLSARGKNNLFLNNLYEILEIDSYVTKSCTPEEFVKYLKQKMTSEVVYKIHEQIPLIWPDEEDLNRCLQYLKEDKKEYAFYQGDYSINITRSVLNRHAMYEDCFILLDPFMEPRGVYSEYSPLEHPEKHKITTLKNVFLWLSLTEWIKNGLVIFIRSPGDFNYPFEKQTLAETEKISNTVELKEVLDEEVKCEIENFFNPIYDSRLDMPIDDWLEFCKDSNIPEEYLREFIQKKKDFSLNHIEGLDDDQLLKHSGGSNFYMGKHICLKTGAHLLTDINFRWKQLEYDRRINDVKNDIWTPFSKAFNNLDMKFFKGLDFDDLLNIRKGENLNDIRSFLRRIWNINKGGDDFSDDKAKDLSAELTHQTREANREWEKIDKSLIDWIAGGSIFASAGTTFSASVLSGSGIWVPFATMAVGAGVKMHGASKERKSFLHNYPAGYFIDQVRKKSL